MPTFFKPPSLYLLHNFSFLILSFLFPHKNIFWICCSLSITEFGIIVYKANYTIFEMVKDLKIVIFPSKVSFLICYSLITLALFFRVKKVQIVLEFFIIEKMYA